MRRKKVRYVNFYAVRQALRDMDGDCPEGKMLLGLLRRYSDQTEILSPHALDDGEKQAVERALNVRLVPVGPSDLRA